MILEEILLLLIIVLILGWLFGLFEDQRAKTASKLRALVQGTLSTPPPSPVTSAGSPVTYTLRLGTNTLGPGGSLMSAPITPGSPIHNRLSITVIFGLCGAGSATLNGVRSFPVAMDGNGNATISIKAVSNGSDTLSIIYAITNKADGTTAIVPDPGTWLFETHYP